MKDSSRPEDQHFDPFEPQSTGSDVIQKDAKIFGSTKSTVQAATECVAPRK